MNPRRLVDGVVDLRHDDRRDVSQLYTSSRGGIAERLRLVQAHDADILVDIMHAGEELLAVEQGHLDCHPSLLSKTQVLDDSRHRQSLAPDASSPVNVTASLLGRGNTPGVAEIAPSVS